MSRCAARTPPSTATRVRRFGIASIVRAINQRSEASRKNRRMTVATAETVAMPARSNRLPVIATLSVAIFSLTGSGGGAGSGGGSPRAAGRGAGTGSGGGGGGARNGSDSRTRSTASLNCCIVEGARCSHSVAGTASRDANTPSASSRPNTTAAAPSASSTPRWRNARTSGASRNVRMIAISTGSRTTAVALRKNSSAMTAITLTANGERGTDALTVPVLGSMIGAGALARRQRDAKRPLSSENTTSTRRFIWRPSGVALLATGCA
jgi:hypothetical protein